MNWTNEKPTVPGWYWWRQLAVDHPGVIVSVSFINGGMHLSFVAEYGTYVYSEIGREESQFAGPIPEPTD